MFFVFLFLLFSLFCYEASLRLNWFNLPTLYDIFESYKVCSCFICIMTHCLQNKRERKNKNIKNKNIVFMRSVLLFTCCFLSVVLLILFNLLYNFTWERCDTERWAYRLIRFWVVQRKRLASCYGEFETGYLL